jgi:hypothetical protein
METRGRKPKNQIKKTISFRPSEQVLKILSPLKKGDRTKFIEDCILKDYLE